MVLSQWVKIGLVGRPHGLRGEFFVAGRDEPLPDSYTLIAIGSDPEWGEKSRILKARTQGQQSVLQCEAATDRAMAQALCGRPIWVRRCEVHIDTEQNYLWADLIGRAVDDCNGKPLGHVLSVYNVGASDILTVRDSTGDAVELPLVYPYFDATSFPALGKGEPLLLLVDSSVFAGSLGSLAQRRADVMMSMHFLTIHPELIHAYEGFGVFRSAQEQNLASISTIDLRDFAGNPYRSVDDKPYGGGDGMVMRPDPLAAAIQSLPTAPFVILTSPAGTPWRHQFALNLSQMDRPIVFVCARFGGVDQRFVDKYVHAEYSIGDFVISGGELPCLIIADSILRQIPGVLGNDESALWDSFTAQNRGQLEHPVYTRPREFEGQKVPEPLTSGDHNKVAKWKSSEALRRTILKRPDLLQRH